MGCIIWLILLPNICQILNILNIFELLPSHLINFVGKITHKGRGVAIYTISSTLAQGIIMFYALILARYLGPDKYGYYASGYSLVGLWSFIIGLGMDTWLLRKGGNCSFARLLVGNILKLKCLIFSIWAPMVILGIKLLSNNSLFPWFLIVCALDIFGDNNLTTIIYGLNITQQYSRIAKVLLFSRLGRLFGALSLIIFGVRSPFVFALVRLLFTVISLTVALSVFRPTLKREFFEHPLYIVKESIPFALSDMIVQIYMVADVFLLSILTTPLQVGLYSPASNLLSALFVIPSTVYLSLIPIFSRKILDQNQLSKRIMLISIGGLGVLGLFLTLIVGLGSRWIVPAILGQAYGETSVLLTILSPILFLKFLQFGLVAVIVSVGWQKYRLLPQIIAASVNLSLNLVVIPSQGAKGAAIVYNLSEILLLCGYIYLVLLYFSRIMNKQRL
ncbi:MAG: oligosaccharide flippase family protein [Candidatus Methanomethyliaceae archaeon]